MSPEQVGGKRVGPQSDVFSIGVVLYQLLCAQYPFDGEHPMAVMYSITNTAPQPVVERVGDVPVELQAILAHALEKNPAERYADAGQFADALRELIGVEAAPAPRSVLLSPRVLIPAFVVLVAAVFAAVYFARGPSYDTELAKNSNELGITYQEAGDIENAQIEFRKAIAADPTYAVAWNNLGMLAVLAGDLTEADSLFRMAIENDPGYEAAHYNLGSVRWDRGDLKGAEESFRFALEADSSLVGGYNNLGVLLLEDGRFEEARDVLAKGLTIAPEAPYLLKNRGRVELALGSGEAAAGYWERAIDIDPGYTDAHRLLAGWCETNGEIEKAKFHWGEVLKADREEDRRAAGEALQRIETQ
jgi:tetratricopeptide (TPR) repeat protein